MRVVELYVVQAGKEVICYAAHLNRPFLKHFAVFRYHLMLTHSR